MRISSNAIRPSSARALPTIDFALRYFARRCGDSSTYRRRGRSSSWATTPVDLHAGLLGVPPALVQGAGPERPSTPSVSTSCFRSPVSVRWPAFRFGARQPSERRSAPGSGDTAARVSGRRRRRLPAVDRAPPRRPARSDRLRAAGATDQVPVVPMVAHGSHDVIIVLAGATPLPVGSDSAGCASMSCRWCSARRGYRAGAAADLAAARKGHCSSV